MLRVTYNTMLLSTCLTILFEVSDVEKEVVLFRSLCNIYILISTSVCKTAMLQMIIKLLGRCEITSLKFHENKSC